MTSISVAAVVLGVAAVVIAIVALALARSRRTHIRRGKDLAAATQRAESRAMAAEASARAADARVQTAVSREEAILDELRHLESARLPALALHLISDHHPVPGPLHEDVAETGDKDLFGGTVDQFTRALLKERRRVDAAARAALRGASQDMQALSYRLQTEIDALQHEFSAPRSLTKRLLTADHVNEQNIRLIQRTAIVCGAWPGHVRRDTYVAELVSGASSRLRGFERVKVNSRLHATNIGIVGRAAEPIAVACAELMANALEHSRDDLMVDVSLFQTENGSVCVTIDDAGKGMTAEAVARGVRLVSGDQDDVMLTELGDPPSQGFAAIGRLVADYGFHVSIDNPSPYGGVRAVVSIPPNLLTSIDEEAQPLSAMAPLPAAAPQVQKRPAPETPEPPSRTPKPTAAAAAPELPQRHRRGALTSAEESVPAEPRALDPDRVRDTWAQFEQGLASGRADTDPEETS